MTMRKPKNGEQHGYYELKRGQGGEHREIEPPENAI